MAAKKIKKAQRSPKDVNELLEFVEGLKRQWMSTIDALVDPLIIVDKNYVVRKANLAMAKACKTEIKDLIGKRCYEAFAQSKKPCEGCKMHSAYKEKKPQVFELDSIRDSFFEVSSQPIIDDKGDIEGVVHIYRDQTDSRNLREQLLQSEKLSSIGLLAGGVAHEINNPLGGILVFSQMLLREMPVTSPHYADVKEILHATERCKSIVESLLDFARTNTTSKKAKTEVFSATEAAKTAMRFGKVAIPKHMITVEEEWGDRGNDVVGDRNKLIQLFLNLIQNAIQAMPDGGTLVLRSSTVTKQNKNYVQFDIIDSGVGIPDAHKRRIFDPFFTTKEPGEGTGLGLAICYGIVKDLGGKLSFESKVNEGSTFTVLIPLSEKKKQSQKKSA